MTQKAQEQEPLVVGDQRQEGQEPLVIGNPASLEKSTPVMTSFGPVMRPSTSEIGRTVEAAGSQLGAMGKGALSLLLKPLAPQIWEQVKAVGRELGGRPQPGKSALSAPQGLLDRILGAGETAMGGDPGAARMEFQAGHPGAGLADLYTVPIVSLLSGEMARKIPGKPGMPPVEKRANLLTKASGATEGKAFDFPKEFATALPELDKTPPKVPFEKMTVADLNNHVQDTFNRLESDFNGKLGPIARQPVLAQPVAQEIRSYKIANPVLPEDIAWNDALENRAVLFDRQHTLGDLNVQRMRARDRIGDFNKQFPSTQGSKMGSHVNIVMDTAINDATRDIIYNTLDNVYQGQVPPDYFRNLKRTEASLYNIKDQLSSRVKQLSNMSAKSFLDRARIHSYVNPTGHVGAAVGGMAEAIFPESKSAVHAVRQAFKPKADLKPALGGALPPLIRRQQPSLAPNEGEEEQQ